MTPRMLLLVGAASVGLVCSLPAMAEYRQLASSGLWSAYGGTGDDGRALCGIGTEGAETRRILIQQYAGESGLEIRLRKDSWAIPANTPVEFQVQVDSGEPTVLQATGTEHQVVVAMTFDQSIPFMRGIRAGRQIRVVFPSGSELPWTGALTGSGRAMNAFNSCRAGLGPAVVTQPFAPSPSAAPPRQ